MTEKFVWFDERELFDGYLSTITNTEVVMFLNFEYNPTDESSAIYKRIIPSDGISYFIRVEDEPANA